VDPSDPDDWFAGTDPDDLRRPDPASGEDARPWADDWLDEAEEVASRRPSWAEAIDRRVLVVVGSLIVLLIAGLAAGGVFSGGGGPKADTSTTTGTAQTTTAQTQTTATTAAQPPQPPTTTLKPGDTGVQVVNLQHVLASLGYSPGKADGNYGPATTAAVKRFQGKAGLTADGIVGQQTLAALVTALRASG